MSVPGSSRLIRTFRRVLQARVPIVLIFLALTAVGIHGVLKVPDDPAIERLVVANDPVARATADFERLFPEGEQALVVFESADPLSLASLQAVDRAEQQLAKIPKVEAHSLLDLYRHGGAKRELTADDVMAIRKFATSTRLFRGAGLLGDRYLGVGLQLRVK